MFLQEKSSQKESLTIKSLESLSLVDLLIGSIGAAFSDFDLARSAGILLFDGCVEIALCLVLSSASILSGMISTLAVSPFVNWSGLGSSRF